MAALSVDGGRIVAIDAVRDPGQPTAAREPE